jgi:hypothetical protein
VPLETIMLRDFWITTPCMYKDGLSASGVYIGFGMLPEMQAC